MKNFSSMWVLKSLKGGLKEKGVLVFLGGGGSTPQCTPCLVLCAVTIFFKLV